MVGDVVGRDDHTTIEQQRIGGLEHDVGRSTTAIVGVHLR